MHGNRILMFETEVISQSTLQCENDLYNIPKKLLFTFYHKNITLSIY